MSDSDDFPYDELRAFRRTLKFLLLIPYCLWIIIVTVLALPWMISVFVESKYRDDCLEQMLLWQVLTWFEEKL